MIKKKHYNENNVKFKYSRVFISLKSSKDNNLIEYHHEDYPQLY